MAVNKKSVVIYTDWIHTFESLKDNEAGKLIKHFLRYVNDMNPDAPSKLIQIAFEPIKQQLKRDLNKWETIKSKRSDAGKISAEKRKHKPTNSTHVESVQQTSTNSTVNDNVNVNVINKSTQYFVELRVNEILNSAIWMEQVAMKQKISFEKLRDYLIDFLNVESLKSNFIEKSIGENKDHFVNWLRIKIQNEKNKKSSINHNQPVN